jgi:nitrate reductase NapAB chaperone NapD
MAKDYLKLMKKGQKIEGDPYPNNLSVVIDTTLGRTRLHFDAKRTKLIASTDSPEIIDFLQLDKNGKNPVVVPDEKMEDFLDFIEKPENLKSVVAIRLVSANSLIRNIPDELLKEINNYRNDKDLELPPLQVMEMQGLSISFNKGTCTKYADYRLDIIANYGSKGQPPALTITKVQESKSGANDSYFVREKEKIDNIFSGTTDKGNLLFPESYLKLTGKAMEIVDKAKHILNPNK